MNLFGSCYRALYRKTSGAKGVWKTMNHFTRRARPLEIVHFSCGSRYRGYRLEIADGGEILACLWEGFLGVD